MLRDVDISTQSSPPTSLQEVSSVTEIVTTLELDATSALAVVDGFPLEAALSK